MSEEEIPMPVRMFLCFGYVDEELAGVENAEYLSRAVHLLSSNKRPGVFTLFEWLKAVFEGTKEPSRNEFDEDYSTHLRTLKATKQITPAEEAALLQDFHKKVEYELKNMFPTVNKMSFGRVSSFCPLFSAHNLLKRPDTTLVMPQTVKELFADIISMDYGAYYREYVYTNPEAGMPQEFFHTEILPDVILMPNVGTRGVMWQEIEGKRRSTPSRMLFSIFQLEDLEAILIRLTGEFRWEMCKRIQGARWNDLSEKSLTSEYFDYIQFYKKNSELSTDAKEKIKTDLGRTKNNFKEMFLRDYLLWIMFESNSSPRLNKVARGIFFTYCTFTSPVRQKLRANPLYQDLVDRGEIKMKQKRHKMENICQKLRTQGKEIPEEIQKEMDFMNM